MEKEKDKLNVHEMPQTDKRKKRYEAPAVVEEQTFETMVLGCTGSNPFCGSVTS